MPVDLNNLATKYKPGHPKWWIQDECRQWHREQLARLTASPPPYPGGNGRGIVTVATADYLPAAYVLCRSIREAGWKQPIRVVGNGVDLGMLSRLDVEITTPPDRSLPQQWKTWAVLTAPWRECLLLDADTAAVENPMPLFSLLAQNAATFWVLPHQQLNRRVCGVFGVPHRREPMVEGGHVMVDREKGWPAVAAADWLNEHAAYTYTLADRHYDSVTWPVAFRAAGLAYTLMPEPEAVGPALVQPGISTRPAFVHRYLDKFKAGREPKADDRLPGEAARRQWLRDYAA